jgi:hypothetical protein
LSLAEKVRKRKADLEMSPPTSQMLFQPVGNQIDARLAEVYALVKMNANIDFVFCPSSLFH